MVGYSHLRTFGCFRFAANVLPYKGKFDRRAHRCVFLGYVQGQKGYRVYNLNANCVMVYRDVIFHKNVFPFQSNVSVETGCPLPLVPDVINNHVESPMHANLPSTSETLEQEYVPIHAQTSPEPKTFKQVVQHKECQAAMEAEIQALEKNNTWSISESPPNKRAISCRWIYKTKLKPDGIVKRHKVRLVAKGSNQIEGEDYTDCFAPVERDT
ncbi:UNVERIFIED_CONTAM: hypothetical protein Sradi_0849900 [Sesamum radiatum]|uniref:Reverse transcriptase Ty1/copia-type domain-containing protein n=1 Tax=Sesamum radiatum TaxID=300843 RepID=A0AAW2V476_SESRA